MRLTYLSLIKTTNFLYLVLILVKLEAYLVAQQNSTKVKSMNWVPLNHLKKFIQGLCRNWLSCYFQKLLQRLCTVKQITRNYIIRYIKGIRCAIILWWRPLGLAFLTCLLCFQGYCLIFRQYKCRRNLVR